MSPMYSPNVTPLRFLQSFFEKMFEVNFHLLNILKLTQRLLKKAFKYPKLTWSLLKVDFSSWADVFCLIPKLTQGFKRFPKITDSEVLKANQGFLDFLLFVALHTEFVFFFCSGDWFKAYGQDGLYIWVGI